MTLLRTLSNQELPFDKIENYRDMMMNFTYRCGFHQDSPEWAEIGINATLDDTVDHAYYLAHKGVSLNTLGQHDDALVNIERALDI